MDYELFQGDGGNKINYNMSWEVTSGCISPSVLLTKVPLDYLYPEIHIRKVNIYFTFHIMGLATGPKHLTHQGLNKMAGMFKCIFLNCSKFTTQISYNSKGALVQVMVQHQTGNMPLPEAIMKKFQSCQ